MNKEQFERESRYGAAMALAREMLNKGLISDKDYCKIDTIFKRKYRPIIGALQTENP